jgi:TldD protein
VSGTSELEFVSALIADVPAGCSYADARWVSRREEVVEVRNGRVEGVSDEQSEGIGVRVRVDGAWGFAATGHADPAGARRALARAMDIADRQPRRPARPLAGAEAARGHFQGPGERDPFAVAIEAKVAHLLAAEEPMRGDARIVRSQAQCRSALTESAFASTEGTACSQSITECGGAISAVAVDGGEMQIRSYPGAHGGSAATAGWEQVIALDLQGHAPRVAEEAIALLSAPPCPAGPATIVLHGEQLALQVHESIGHALELDRILLGEASYAGTSWVPVEELGRLRYGSPLLNVTADATLPGGLGSFGWDDEGCPARRTTLIEGGVLVNALSDRESAAEIGLTSSGACARAAGFARQPMVRMTNVSIEPGEAGSLNDLIADTDRGLYLETNRSWSIDDRRLHFQFGTELAREIDHGELGRLYRNPTYSGITPSFWGSLDAVCSQSEWRLFGLLNCGKGEPGQTMHVSHGAAPARFTDVQVGV